MIEVRCAKCGKIAAYLAPKSRMANGTILVCVRCQRPAPSMDVPDFFKGLFK